MTIQEAIDTIDKRKPNMTPPEQKVAWLSDLDGLIWREIFMNSEGIPDGVTYEGYDEETPRDTELLAPAPYTDIYRHYMALQIDIDTRETNEYAKDQILYNSAWQTLCDYWNRKHMPKSKVTEIRF